ncbi:UNVERIFIED_CONTAM: hypothetical protein RKD43_006796 [Streptomyces graminofaciens]
MHAPRGQAIPVRTQGRVNEAMRTLFVGTLVMIAGGLAYFMALGLMHR